MKAKTKKNKSVKLNMPMPSIEMIKGMNTPTPPIELIKIAAAMTDKLIKDARGLDVVIAPDYKK